MGHLETGVRPEERQVRVDAVGQAFHPGPNGTDPVRGACLDALEIALHFLAAEQASSFVTGAIIRVDGGFTAGMSITAYNTLASE